MGGFFGWFLVLVFVLAVFNAEKLPALKEMLEEKFKDSVDVAKEGSKLAKDKIKKIKADAEAKKAESVKTVEAEENTPEEIEDALQFMGNYVQKKKAHPTPKAEKNKPVDELEKALNASSAEENKADKPVDLEQNYK